MSFITFVCPHRVEWGWAHRKGVLGITSPKLGYSRMKLTVRSPWGMGLPLKCKLGLLHQASWEQQAHLKGLTDLFTLTECGSWPGMSHSPTWSLLGSLFTPKRGSAGLEQRSKASAGGEVMCVVACTLLLLIPAEAGRAQQFRASLGHIVSSQPASAAQ